MAMLARDDLGGPEDASLCEAASLAAPIPEVPN
jgi:hypothetical protein